jgi:hypothetical protein
MILVFLVVYLLAEREELEWEAALQTYHVIGVEEDSS